MIKKAYEDPFDESIVTYLASSSSSGSDEDEDEDEEDEKRSETLRKAMENLKQMDIPDLPKDLGP